MAKDEVYVDADGEPVRVSSPGKVMFPEQGWTKLDVVEHYLRCGPGILNAVRGRPCMLKRWTKGVGEPPFYQKRAPKDARETTPIRFPAARPGRMVVARELRDVIWMAQLNCIDIHPWPVTTDDLDHPNELRIDLDPAEGATFDMTREVAAVCRELLEEHGLTGWPKTSGSRGIHIYARIEPRWEFNDVRRAAVAFAREVERRAPGLATTAWWKEERSGVFLDYNQNARDKTIASAYSVRDTGRVSAPFRWDELMTIDPLALDLRGFAERWDEVGDLAAGMDDAAGRLDGLLALAGADDERGLPDLPWPPHYAKQPNEPPRVAPSRRRKPKPDPGE